MLDLDVIDDPAAAVAALDPVRGSILAALAVPGSSTTVAKVLGERVVVSASGAPAMSGTVVDAAPWRLAVLLDEPCPGTAFLAVEGAGEQLGVSIWSYLYGFDRALVAARDEPRWQNWLTEHAPRSNG